MKNIWTTIIETFRANKNKPAYWSQIIGSILVVGFVIGNLFFGLNLDGNTIAIIVLGIGSVLAVLGTVSDNSVLEDTGNTVKSGSGQVAVSEKAIEDALKGVGEAIKTAQEANKQANEAKSTADKAQSVASEAKEQALPAQSDSSASK